MKKNYLLIFSVLLFTCASYAQNVRSFKGRVVDSATFKPLPDATISIYRASDTSLLNFGFTTPNGNFQITAKSSDSLLIIISLFGYNEHVIKEAASEWDWRHYDDIKLSPMPQNFRGVTLKVGAIRMKGDTIEINASRFKVLPGSDVAQLFKKIPGFEVSVKGEIKVNGSPVSKILVDGSDFFGNNPGMVSKNLSADMIETVQVFEDLNPDGSPKEEAAKVINLKLKKGKRNGMFGDFMAGYGTKDRYEAGARINSFKNDRKLSFIVNGNNTNETGFDFGFQNWHSADAIPRNGSSGGEDFFYIYNDNRGEGNINNKLGTGFTYFNEFSRKRKLSFNVYGNRNNYSSINSSRSFNPVNDSTQRSNTDSSAMNGLAMGGSLEVTYSQEIDSTGWYEIGFNTSSSNNTSTTNSTNIIRLNELLLNQGVSTLRNALEKKDMGFVANFSRTYRKDDRYSISVYSNYDMKDHRNSSFQFIENTNDTFNNLNERSTKTNESLVKIFSRMPIYKKLLFNLSADRWLQLNSSEQLSRNAQNRFSSQFEQVYNDRIDTLSMQLDNRMEQYTVKPYLSLRKKVMYFASGVTFMKLNINNQFRDSANPISTDYSKLLPYFQFSYYPSKAYIYVIASKSTVFPTISELLPIMNIANNYERRIGNKDLAPQDNYSLRTYFNFYKLKGFKYFHISARTSMSDNAKIWVNRQNENGTIIKTPENAKGKKDLETWFSFSKKMTKVLNLNLWITCNSSKNPLIINEQRAFGTNNVFMFNPGINFTKSDSLDLTVGMSLNYNDYRNSLNEALNFKQVTSSYNINIRALLKTGTELNSTLDISDQRNVPGIGKIVPVWNAYVQQPLGKKGKYNIKLTAYDILNRNTNITRYAQDNFVFINQSNRLQQYFMLTLVYKIKKMGGDEGADYVY